MGVRASAWVPGAANRTDVIEGAGSACWRERTHWVRYSATYVDVVAVPRRCAREASGPDGDIHAQVLAGRCALIPQGRVGVLQPTSARQHRQRGGVRLLEEGIADSSIQAPSAVEQRWLNSVAAFESTG